MHKLLLIALLSMPGLFAMHEPSANERTIQDVLKLVLEDKRDLMNRLETAQKSLDHGKASVNERKTLHEKIFDLKKLIDAREADAKALIDKARN